MPELSVPWGPEPLTVRLPEHWTLQQVVRPSLREANGDWGDRLAAALAQPGAGRSLGDLLRARRGGRVCILIEDLTRHSPLPEILETVMREIHHASVPDANVELFIASGMHEAMTPEQVRGKVGPLADALTWRCNPWQDPKAYVRVGTVEGDDVWIDRGVAEADLRIIVSSVSPHLQAGFGGGYKMLIPGASALPTIRAAHRRGVERGFHQLVGLDAQRNAMRAFIDAAGTCVDEHHGASFAVHYVLDDRDRPAYVGAGAVLPTQQMLAKQSAVACGVLIPRRADVVLTNAHPRDHDLWQSFKAIPNTIWAARPNGVIICLARCPGGLGGMKLPRFAPGPKWTRRFLRAIGPEALGSLLTRLAPSLAGDAAFFVRLALGALYRNHIVLVSPALHQANVRFPGLEIVPDVEHAVAFTQQHLGDGPQTVVAFPSGGITFPVPPPNGTRTNP